MHSGGDSSNRHSPNRSSCEELAMKRLSWLMFLVAGIPFLGSPFGISCAEDKKGTVVEIDGLSSRVPAEWKEEETTNKMRAYQFLVPRVKEDKADAEMIIFFFGTGSGGSADDNIKRWKGMFLPPEGKKIEDVAKVERMKVAGVDVTYLDVQGSYKYKARPFDPQAKEELRPDYRMLGVVFASPKGPYFFRLVGPNKTVTHHKPGFDEWLKGFK
jgi:hypothetical protein